MSVNQTMRLPGVACVDVLTPAHLDDRQLEAVTPLSEDQIRRFREDGFLVVPRTCDDVALQRIRSTLMDLFRRRAGRDEGNQFDMLSLDAKPGEAVQPQIVKPHLYAPALLRSAHYNRVEAMACQLLGPEAQFSFDHSILKPAGRQRCGHALAPGRGLRRGQTLRPRPDQFLDALAGRR